jgi:hypothetical protein
MAFDLHGAFVVGIAADAERIGRSSHRELCEFDGLDAPGISGVDMAQLYAIVTGAACSADFVENFMQHESYIYAESEEGVGPWVYLVPDKLVDRLATLSQAELIRVAVEWAKPLPGRSRIFGWPADLKAFLQELVALARRAVSEGKALLMWICL